MTNRAKTYPYQRHTFGDSGANSFKNILSVAFGYTHTNKKVSAAAAAAVMASTNGSSSAAVTVTTGLVNPDVARNLTVTVGGTGTSVAAADIVVTGTNVEGAVISETFDVVENTPATLVGNKAFRTVTSVLIPQQDGAGVTVTVGTGAKIGLNHRTSSGTVFNILTDIAGVKALEAASADANSTSAIENNTVTPTTAPDAATFYTIYYYDPTWHLSPTNDEPNVTV